MYIWILVFTVFLINRNISSKIKRSKVTYYAALMINHMTRKAEQPACSLIAHEADNMLEPGVARRQSQL